MTRDTLHVCVLALLLTLAGVGVFAYKAFTLGFPVMPDTEGNSRIIEAKVSFTADGGPVTVKAALPRSGAGISVIDVHTVAPGYGDFRKKDGLNRYSVFEKRRTRKGDGAVYYRARVLPPDVSARNEERKPKPVTDFSDRERDKLLRGNAPPVVAVLENFIQEAREQSADARGLTVALIDKMQTDGRRVSEAAAVSGINEFTSPAERLTFVLNAAGVPARSVTGIFAEKEARRAPFIYRTEAYVDGAWEMIDPAQGMADARSFFVPLVYGDAPLYDAEGAEDAHLTIAVRRATESQATQAIWRSLQDAPVVSALSLLALPTDAQLVFKVLLMVPIGALIITLLRQIIGLKTFGTFMPVLIALAFRETQLLNGIILFTVIVGLGLIMRGYFNRLKLLLVPRLAGMLTIVTLLVTVLALIGEAFHVSAGFSIALFPMVIITMTIENMSLDWDEYGAREALSRVAGSLFAASIGYMFISNPYIEHLFFIFPELLLVILAASVLLGRYNGYTLAEFYRFRQLRRTIDTGNRP